MLYEIRQQSLDLACDDYIPAQYSDNIEFQFVKDTEYLEYAVTPYIAYKVDSKYETYALEIDNDLKFTLPAQAFLNTGYIRLAFSLSYNGENVQTTVLRLWISESEGGVTVLPEDDATWQNLVTSLVSQLLSTVPTQTEFDALEVIVDANTTHIATNTTNIATNTSDIAANENSITAIDTRVTATETKNTSQDTTIASNTTAIATNTTNITTNTSNITALDTRVGINETNISTNTTNIARCSLSWHLTLPVTGWTDHTTYYSIDMATTGMLSTDLPIVALDLDGTEADYSDVANEFNYIDGAVSGTDILTFNASTIPTITIDLVVRL